MHRQVLARVGRMEDLKSGQNRPTLEKAANIPPDSNKSMAYSRSMNPPATGSPKSGKAESILK
jgi:hypothetical protein